MGEADGPKKTPLAQASEDAMVVDTMGGRVHVRWDETAQATPHGQIVFFAELLATAGVLDRWVADCPLHYSSPNASRPRDVLGTLMLGILAGSKRYAHPFRPQLAVGHLAAVHRQQVQQDAFKAVKARVCHLSPFCGFAVPVFSTAGYQPAWSIRGSDTRRRVGWTARTASQTTRCRPPHVRSEHVQMPLLP